MREVSYEDCWFNQYRTQTYLRIVESAWAPTNLAQILSGKVFKKTLDQTGKSRPQSNLDTLNCKTLTGKVPNHGEGSSVPLKYTGAIHTGMPMLTLEKYISICSCIYDFVFVFFSLLTMGIFTSIFLKSQSFLLLFHLLFRRLWKLLYQLKIYQQTVFNILINTN